MNYAHQRNDELPRFASFNPSGCSQDQRVCRPDLEIERLHSLRRLSGLADRGVVALVMVGAR